MHSARRQDPTYRRRLRQKTCACNSITHVYEPLQVRKELKMAVIVFSRSILVVVRTRGLSLVTSTHGRTTPTGWTSWHQTSSHLRHKLTFNVQCLTHPRAIDTWNTSSSRKPPRDAGSPFWSLRAVPHDASRQKWPLNHCPHPLNPDSGSNAPNQRSTFDGLPDTSSN